MVSALVSRSSAPGPSPGWRVTLCCEHSWARHFILTVPLSTQVYKMATVKLKKIYVKKKKLNSGIFGADFAGK